MNTKNPPSLEIHIYHKFTILTSQLDHVKSINQSIRKLYGKILLHWCNFSWLLVAWMCEGKVSGAAFFEYSGSKVFLFCKQLCVVALLLDGAASLGYISKYWHCITQNTLYSVTPWFMVTILHSSETFFFFFHDYMKINAKLADAFLLACFSGIFRAENIVHKVEQVTLEAKKLHPAIDGYTIPHILYTGWVVFKCSSHILHFKWNYCKFSFWVSTTENKI